MRERRRNYSWRKKERGSSGEGKVVELIREREREGDRRERGGLDFEWRKREREEGRGRERWREQYTRQH